MNLTRYDDVHAFYQRVEPFLMQREAEHCLMLGILSAIMKKPDMIDEPPYLAIVEADAQIAAVIIQTPPFNLVFSHIEEPQCAEVIQLVVDDLAGDTLPGVLGEVEIAKNFAEAWAAQTGVSQRAIMNERIYRLDTVTPVAGVSGYMRNITEDDREFVIQWLVDFAKGALPDKPEDHAVERHEKMFENALKQETRGLRLWIDNDQPVCLVGFGGRTPNGNRIGPVYTPPEFRKKGYGSALTAAVTQMLLDEGRTFCFLFTDLANPTSNHIYQEIGYKPVCDFDMYKFE